MADRGNHYERAFDAYVRTRQWTCIPVDETRRAVGVGASLKSLDFIVMGHAGRVLLVDVKGRKLTGMRGFENWATEDDLVSLARWQQVFGPPALALLAFVYVTPPARPAGTTGGAPGANPFASVTACGEHSYGCLAVPLADYRSAMRLRSPRWRTYNLGRADFARLARPLEDFCAPPPGGHRANRGQAA